LRSILPPNLYLLFGSLVIAVTALSSVSFFGDRINKALLDEQSAILAADLVLEKNRPIPNNWLLEAKALDLKVSRFVTFPSVLFILEKPQLVRIKAVQSNYPLKGKLEIESKKISSNPPAYGEVAIAAKLFTKLKNKSKLIVGNTSLKIIGKIKSEPDVSSNIFQIAPRILINWDDIKNTGLLGPASRASYKLLVSGDPEKIDAFKSLVNSNYKDINIIEPGSGRPEINSAIETGQKFLNLSALCASILAGIAIMLATRRFLNLVLGEAAILRTLGMTPVSVLYYYLKKLMMLVIIASIIGSFFGYVSQAGLVYIAQDFISDSLPSPGMNTFLYSFLHALILVFGFSFPTLYMLKKVPPMHVLAKKNISIKYSYGIVGFIAAISYLLLVLWQVKNFQLSMIMVSSLIAILCTFSLIGILLKKSLRPLRKNKNFSISLAALDRDQGLSLLQISGYGLAITLLMILTLLRVDILDNWEKDIPLNSPNYFLINIQEEEVIPLKNLFLKNDIQVPNFYQTVRGRLKKISDKKIQPEILESPRARRLAEREFNLGFSSKLQSDNKIISGEWFSENEKSFSVEMGIAKQLNINIGDVLTFDIAGKVLSAPVSSLRTVSWESFNVNFFVQGSPALLEDIPYVYITSAFIGNEKQNITQIIGNDFPAISLLSIDSLLDKIKEIIAKGTLAIEGIFFFTLLAAILVSIAAIQISKSQRAEEISLLKIIGASRGKILGLVMAEFLILGLIAGLIGSFFANILSISFAHYLFEIESNLNFLSILFGSLIGIITVGLIGYISCHSLLKIPPIQVLQK
tara:strand:- start:6344 stop:8758 length:2415 start_codon:yes stop_codon:yes gene_type:complete